ncbi:MAG: CDP-diacylglycerol--glycerol-3-phosphate 3-phosphatidyltransferase [Alphaproteobacteria bacterium]
MKWTIPNILTLLRLVLIPAIAYLIICPCACSLMVFIAFGLFVLAALSDFADGYIARKYNQYSDFGRCFDPIADKVLVVIVLVSLVADGTLKGLLIIPVFLILVREILISGLREFMAEKNVPMPVSKLAKWKTAVQMIALTLLILVDQTVNALGTATACVAEIAFATLWLSAVLTVVTGWAYLKSGFKHMG